ncbi:MAG: TRAP transporter small permease, partial [Deferribacterales bacterium]
TFFLAMAQTFIKNEHIRVNIVLSRLKQPFKKFLEVFIHLAAIFIVSYLTYFSIRLAYFSFKFNDISQLPDATPLWIPQISFGLGCFVFLLAIIENLINIIKGKGN